MATTKRTLRIPRPSRRIRYDHGTRPGMSYETAEIGDTEISITPASLLQKYEGPLWDEFIANLARAKEESKQREG